MSGLSVGSITRVLPLFGVGAIVVLTGRLFLMNRELPILNSEIEQLREEKRILQDELADDTLQFNLEGRKISFGSLQKSDLFPVFLSGKSRYLVAILFTHLDCGTCVSQELHLWQRFYDKMSDHEKLKIVAIAHSSDPEATKASVRGIFQYPLLFDSQGFEKSLFSVLDLPRGRPIALLVDETDERIIYAHVGSINRRHKADAFVRKVRLFLEMPVIDANAE